MFNFICFLYRKQVIEVINVKMITINGKDVNSLMSNTTWQSRFVGVRLAIF